MSKTASRLSLPRALAFAGIGVPLAAIGLPMGVFVAPMYAGELGLGTAVVGLVMMLLRFWDIATDPIMGWLVDCRPTRFGRIKHWILASVPILMLGSFFVFIPSDDAASPAYLALWLGVLWLGFTMLQTPYASWVPMIAADYDDRSRLFLWREILNTATLLTLLIIPFLLQHYLDLDLREQVMVMGLILLVSLPVSVGLAARFVPDAPPEPTDQPVVFSWPALRSALQDQAVVRLLMVEVLIGIAGAATGSTFLFVARDGFGVTEGASIILLIHFVTGFSAMAGWTWLSRRTDKHIAAMSICGWSSLTFLLYLPFGLSGGGAWLLGLCALVSGIGFGSAPIMLRSMLADVIERERQLTGESRAGLYYSLNSASYKIGASFGIGIPYVLLEALVGYQPGGTNGPAETAGLIWVFVGVPAIAYGLPVLVLRRYPLTRKAYGDLQPPDTP